MSPSLEAFISPVPRYARASNLERDSGHETIADYHLIEPGLDLLRRLVRDTDTRALVVTGPYGSGKSIFALFLDALLGARSDPLTKAACARLNEVDPTLAVAFEQFRERLDPRGRGLVRAIVTGRPEPIAATALRALATGVGRHPDLPKSLVKRVRAADVESARPAEVAALFREVHAKVPVALLIDELGVVLDAALDAADDGLWLLQDLAEAVSGGSGSRGFILALQHRSLAEQIAGGRDLPIGWRKIQGRFEEVAFVESRDALFSLIPRVLQRTPNGELDRAIAAWAAVCSRKAAGLGLDGFLPTAVEDLAVCYPLHPSVLLVLPDLTSSYGQRERTLLAFLAGHEPGAVGDFLESHDAAERPLPSIDLPRVYGFFVGSGSHRLGAPAQVSRWAEVERRIREAGELDELESRTIRAIALLNLVGRGGPARASSPVLEFAVPGAEEVLGRLVGRGLITYRSTSDEYRIWEGSDINLDAVVQAQLAAVDRQRPASLLATAAPLAPTVAAAHSERTGILRTFERRYLGADESSPHSRDGLIWYQVDETPFPEPGTSDPPTIVLHGNDLGRLRTAALNVAALGRLLAQEDVRADWVATREIRERHAIALDQLRGQLDVSFAPPSTRATLLLDGNKIELEPDLLSRLASAACELAFPATPVVRNEMFAIHELTSQGARARSLLFAAMIEHPGQPALGFVGWGPERAMYASTLAEGELHRVLPPHYDASRGSTYAEAWTALWSAMASAKKEAVSVADLLASLEARPYGLRRSLTPVLWLAIMLAEAEQFALFERGTYVPRLSSDVMDRLVKAPDVFAVRHLAARGARQAFVRGLDVRLSLTGTSAPTVVGVVSRIIHSMRRLPAYTLRTGRLPESALEVRAALVSAREPDRLLFEALPAAFGYPPISPQGVVPDDLVDRLSAALVELSGAYRALLGRVRARVAEAFDLADGPSFRTDLRVRSQPLLSHVAERHLRGFLAAATEPALADEEWLEALVVATAMPPLQQWDDETEEAFVATIRELGRTHRRLAVLYAEAWAEDLTEGFVARRVTVTGSDGHETSRLVWIDADEVARMSAFIDELVRNAEHLAGPEATRMIVALLTERLASMELRDDRAQDEDDRRHA